jgi:hypothetical protein
MTALETWLEKATRSLSRTSGDQVRREIREHYESAREAAMSTGATADEAERLAVAALGDAKAANCQYRKVLLTSAEAKVLREGNWEARAICSRPWLKRLLAAVPAAALFAAAALFLTGALAGARVLLAGAIAMGLLFTAPFLPVYTPARGRVFRRVKWVLLISALVLMFGPVVALNNEGTVTLLLDTLKWSWLLTSCLWPLAWIEWTRVSIRRKLPVAQWPRHLYL